MKILKAILPALGLLAVASVPALAADTPTPTATEQHKDVSLDMQHMGDIVVSANEIQTLREIKQALHRVHSTSAADADTLVCHFEYASGSHVNRTLICETNRQWWRRIQVVQTNAATALALGAEGGTSGARALTIGLQQIRATNMAFAVPVNYNRFRAVMRALPKADKASGTGNQPPQ